MVCKLDIFEFFMTYIHYINGIFIGFIIGQSISSLFLGDSFWFNIERAIVLMIMLGINMYFWYKYNERIRMIEQLSKFKE